MKKYFIKVLPILLVPALFSCSMAYIKTSELHAELKQSLDKISNESKNLDQRYSKSKDLLNPYKVCTETNNYLTNSNKMVNGIETNISQLKIIESKINEEFKNFTNYSLNKPVIIEKMPEWQKTQETKRIFNESITQWENQITNLNSAETILTKYISDSLTKLISKANPSDEIAKLNNQITILNGKFNDANSQFLNLKTTITEKIKKYKLLLPDVVKKIENELAQVESKYNELNSPAKELVATRDGFKTKTQNLSTIYSCQSEWKDMLELSVTANEKLVKFNKIESEIVEKRKLLDNLLSKLK